MLMALTLVLLAGGMNGSFAVPMKYVRGWEWEHTWLVWSFLGMLVIPLIVAMATIHHLGAVYGAAGPQTLLQTSLYGAIWGVGTVLFGLGITRVGVALSFGLVLGTSSALGTMIPLISLHRDRLLTAFGLLTLAGVTIILAGILASARAGLLREAAERQISNGSFMAGLGICLLAGLCSCCMNLALNGSAPISRAAEALGASQAVALNAVWPVLLGGGLAVNAAYCVFLLIHRGTVSRFGQTSGANIALVLAMALLWSGSNFVYGAGARWMGPLGFVLGWPIFMAAIVLMANAWGIGTGEWRGAGRRARTWAVAGCATLVCGIWIIASAGSR